MAITRLNNNSITSITALPFSVGITEADEWRLTTNLNNDQDPIASNLERNDSSGFGLLGTGMTQSSGIWSFPSTGHWFVVFKCMLSQNTSSEADGNAQIYVTTDNSTYNLYASGKFSMNQAQNISRETVTVTSLIDVTSTSLVKIKFTVNAITDQVYISGNTGRSETTFQFIKLGNT